MDTLQGAILLAAPLLLAAIGELIAERGGVLNIGIDGTMLCGALAAFAASHATGSAATGLAAAAAAGLCVAVIFGLLTVVLRANQVIVGTGMNLVGMGLTGTLYRAMFGLSSAALTVTPLPAMRIPVLSTLPVLGPLVFGQNALVPLGLLLVPAAWWWLHRTRGGLILRACGEKPEAADTAGHSVVRWRMAGVLAGGALAGVAGGYLSVVQGNTFVEGMTNGRGFIALALVIFGRWSPWGVLGGALLFGLVAQAKFVLAASGGAHVSPQAIEMLPYAAILVVLAAFPRHAGGPAALAEPYRR